MTSNESVTYSLNIKKMRNDLIKGIIKDEEYKKKDEKKKEIIKLCKSYKDFCNIVDCVNMKPIKTYEEKVTYEDYMNANFSCSNSINGMFQKKNRKNNLYFMVHQFKINDKKGKNIPLNNNKTNEIYKFLNILRSNKENYYGFIKSNYDCDDLKNIIYMIKNKWNVLFENVAIENLENKKEECALLLVNLINFLFYLSKYWNEEKFSTFFTEEELNDINLNVNIITEKIKKNYSQNEQVTNQLNCIKNTFLK